MPYLTNTTTRRIEWGECDPAGIVFYPRYFAMFDNATTLLFSAALGMTKYQFLEKYDCAGYPMVDTRARFLAPCRFGDDVVIETAIAEIKRSSFQVTHHLKNNGALAVEAVAVLRPCLRHSGTIPGRASPVVGSAAAG